MILYDLFDFNPSYYGGVSRFALGLMDGIKNINTKYELTIICDSKYIDFFNQNYPHVKVHPVKRRFLDKKIHAMLCVMASLTRMPSLIKLIKYYRRHDLKGGRDSKFVIVPTSTVNFYDIPCTILCIHDIQHEIHPNNFTLIERLHRWARFRISVKYASFVQVSSDFIASNILTAYGENIYIKCFKAYEGYDANIFGSKLTSNKPLNFPNDKFIYYPAQLWPHKNHVTVIKGLSIHNKYNEEITLVISGKDYGQLGKIEIMCRSSSIKLIYMPYVTDSEMRFLYANACAVISAGYHESSSLPLREALACGSEVLAADIAPNMELLSINLVHFFATFDPRDFAIQLSLIPKNPKNISNSIELVSSLFEWSNVAKCYMDKLCSINGK